jgi:hypothetical protein
MTFLVKEALSMSTVNEDDRVRNVAEGLWLKVLKDFDNETVHTVFIDYCIATHQLPRAGANYRTYREQKGNTLLIDTCMKKIVLSALFAAALFLMSGCIAVALWIAFPALRIVLLMGVAIVLAGGMYQLKRKL